MPLHRKTEDAISSKGEEEKGPFAIPPQVMLYVVDVEIKKKKNGKNFLPLPAVSSPVQSSPGFPALSSSTGAALVYTFNTKQ